MRMRSTVVLGSILWTMVAGCEGEAENITVSEEVRCELSPSDSISFPPLPVRGPPPATTTGAVPHQQVDPILFPAAIAELHERVFALPQVERRESLLVPGATAIWIRPEVSVERLECIVAGREVGHIHADGSMHAVIPFGRIPDAESAGWAERHPWSGSQPGFDAFVLTFTPRSSEEVDVMFTLIREGLGFVTDG